MDNIPAIAVIIPCYNHADVLGRTLAALRAQTVKPAEVVVVDDGSTDDPGSVVGDAVTFIRFERNQGAPAARNEGARRTTSPYLLFLDADAELVPDALEAFVHTLEVHPEADFAYSNFLWGTKRFRGQPFSMEALKKRNFIHTISLLRRSAFPGFDESLKKFQDWDLWLMMAKRGSKGMWIDRELFRIEPRRKGTGISRWLPKIAYMIPWQKIGFQPKEVGRYREAERVIQKKHGLI